MNDQEFKFTTKYPVSVSIGGDIQECHEIICKSPTGRHSDHVAQLKQMVKTAVREMTEDESPEELKKKQEAFDVSKSGEGVDPITGSAICNLIQMSSRVKYSDFLHIGTLLLCAGVATIEGVKFNNNMALDMDMKDKEDLIGGYVAFFTDI